MDINSTLCCISCHEMGGGEFPKCRRRHFVTFLPEFIYFTMLKNACEYGFCYHLLNSNIKAGGVMWIFVLFHLIDLCILSTCNQFFGIPTSVCILKNTVCIIWGRTKTNLLEWILKHQPPDYCVPAPTALYNPHVGGLPLLVNVFVQWCH